MGMTPNYVAGVWMGYDIPKSMSGSNYCTSIFRKVMTEIHSKVEEKTIKVPDGVIKRTICQESGKIASSDCSKTLTEYFKDGTQPMTYCSPESHIKEEPEDENAIGGESTTPGGENVQNESATPGVEASESDSESLE